MSCRCCQIGCVLVLGLWVPSATEAQSYYLNQSYGQGVHTFYRGNYQAAERLFDDVINQGLNDPRAYYFRAFTKLRRGDRWGAESDIRQGAGLEVNGAGTFEIGLALERVQGPARLQFESLRRDAVVAAQQSRAGSYEGGRQPSLPPRLDEREYLRQPASPERTQPPADLGPAAPDQGDPFLDDEPADDTLPVTPDQPEETGEDVFGDETLETPPAEPAEPSTGDLGLDPFETKPPAASGTDTSIEEDIFGDKPAADTAPPPPAEVDEATEEDLFGGDELFGDEEVDVFGGDEGNTEAPQ